MKIKITAKFVIEPLERLWYNFGNSLRRVPLSSLQFAVTSIKIDGVLHNLFVPIP